MRAFVFIGIPLLTGVCCAAVGFVAWVGWFIGAASVLAVWALSVWWPR